MDTAISINGTPAVGEAPILDGFDFLVDDFMSANKVCL